MTRQAVWPQSPSGTGLIKVAESAGSALAILATMGWTTESCHAFRRGLFLGPESLLLRLSHELVRSGRFDGHLSW